MDLKVSNVSASGMQKQPFISSPLSSENTKKQDNVMTGDPIKSAETVKFNKKLLPGVDVDHHSLQFSVDKENHQIKVKVIDDASGKVVQEIPPDNVQAMLKDLQTLLGLWVDYST